MQKGYHLSDIPKGTLGELSKIQEELHEAIDAETQNNPIMTILELSDIIVAIDAYIVKNHPSISLHDLIVMANATKRSFLTGERQ